MNYKGVGSVFCLIAAILTSAKYITAATYMSNVPSWSAEDFQLALSYTGPVLTIVSIAAAVVGVIALVWGCIKDGKTESK